MFFTLKFIECYKIGKISAKLHSNSTSIPLDSICQKINTNLQCYEMDPACQLQVPDEVTETRNIMIAAWTIAAALLVAVVFICIFCIQFGGATCAASKYIYIYIFHTLIFQINL